jgi:drug/metabolite transporter (DMT)-like permease
MINVALYAATVLVWGFSWYAIELQIGVVPNEVSVAYRFALAALLQFAWCLIAGVGLRMTARQHVHCAMLGLMIFGANLVLIYYATARLPSGLVSVVFSMITIANIVNGRLFLGRVSPPIVWLASGLGIVGMVLVFREDVGAANLSDGAVIGGLFALAGAYVASLGNVFAISVQKSGLTVLQSNAWGMAYGAGLIALFAALTGKPFLFEATLPYVGGLLYLAVFGSIAGFGFYLTLIRRIGPERAGYTAVMFPAVALLVSAWLEDLTVTPGMMLGAGLILFGNVLVLAPAGALKRLLARG